MLDGRILCSPQIYVLSTLLRHWFGEAEYQSMFVLESGYQPQLLMVSTTVSPDDWLAFALRDCLAQQTGPSLIVTVLDCPTSWP